MIAHPYSFYGPFLPIVNSPGNNVTLFQPKVLFSIKEFKPFKVMPMTNNFKTFVFLV